MAIVSNIENEKRTAEYFKNFDRKKVLQSLVQVKKPTIFDVGANIGTTLVEFKDWWRDSYIHCFEPQYECWEFLSKYAQEYTMNEVTINQCAVSNKSNTDMAFYTHDISSGLASFNKINIKSKDSIYINKVLESKLDKMQEYEKSLNHKRTVEAIRLDDYMHNNDIQHIDLLKIDTQGHEPEVFEGLGSRLSDVSVILTELMLFDYYERSLAFFDLERFLIPAGFSLYDISHISKNPMNGRTDWVDLIYINTKKSNI